MTTSTYFRPPSIILFHYTCLGCILRDVTDVNLDNTAIKIIVAVAFRKHFVANAGIACYLCNNFEANPNLK